MLTFTIDLSAVIRFLLVSCRVGGAMTLAPLVGSERLPMRLKAAFALTFAWLLAPVTTAPRLAGGLSLAIAAVGEILLGLTIGFAARLIFAAVQMAGEMADTQAAFGFAGVVAPDMGQRVSVIGQLQMAVAWLVFVAVNGHRVMLAGMAESFSAVPLGAGPGLCAPALTAAAAGLLGAAVRLAAPIVATALLADLALGLLTRAAPQMNLLAIGFPIKLAAGLLAAMLSLPLLSSEMRSLVEVMQRIMAAALTGRG